MLNKEKFVDLIAKVSEVFGKDLSQEAIRIYYEVLKEYSYDQIERAFYLILQTHIYNTFPKPAEIIEAIEGKQTERSLAAWQTVIDTVRKVGHWDSVSFDDRVIHNCIEALGDWEWLCGQTKDELKFVQKEFERLYTMFSKHPREAKERLIGFNERKNLQGGHKPEKEPERIGDILKHAKQLTNNGRSQPDSIQN